MKEIINDIRLSKHFKLNEFLNLKKYPENIPSMQVVANLTYGCHLLLEPARVVAGPLIINSGFRNPEVNQRVGVSVLPSTFSARLPISGRKTLRSFGRSLNS